MHKNFDVIVIGAGVMGSAVCWRLAQRGIRALCLEQFAVPNAQGASHGQTRAIRMAYFEHPDYIPLLQRAYTIWDELEEIGGQTILHRTGGLYLGQRTSELIHGSLESAIRYAIPHEMLDHPDLTHRYPQFNVPEDIAGFYEPQAGVLLPELAVSQMVCAALTEGGVFHGHETVTEWSADSNGVQVKTNYAEYSAAKLIVCGGAWSSRLLSELQIPLTVTRQAVGWVWPKAPSLFELGTLPMWAMELPDKSLYYGIPMMPDYPGLKVARHGGGEPADPDTLDRACSHKDRETFLPFIQQYLPEANGPVLGMRVCTYTNTPDGHFIIDRHPQHDNVLIAAGFSGHGFKFGTVVGEALADLAQHGQTSLPIDFLSLARFQVH